MIAVLDKDVQHRLLIKLLAVGQINRHVEELLPKQRLQLEK